MVIGLAAFAADERIVLLAQDALTDAEFDGSSHLSFPCPFPLVAHIGVDFAAAQRV